MEQMPTTEYMKAWSPVSEATEPLLATNAGLFVQK
jgi:hypothetical protein